MQSKLYMKYITAILLSILLGSCASDYYAMNKFRNVMFPTVIGYRASNPLSVSLITDDAIRIEENSKTSLRMYKVTQYEKTFILKSKSGNDFRITERSSPLDLDTNRGLKFDFTKTGISIYENNSLILEKSNYIIRNDLDYIFRLIQHGDYTTAIIDCDTIIKFKSNLEATEYTSFQTGEGSEIEIYSFDVQEMYENPEF